MRVLYIVTGRDKLEIKLICVQQLLLIIHLVFTANDRFDTFTAIIYKISLFFSTLQINIQLLRTIYILIKS